MSANGCLCRLLPRSHGLHRISAGSASALWISRPAQASLALRPAGSLDRQKRPLSRGFGPSGYPSKPLVSYQINRQLSGRNPPPLVTRAFGAHRNEANRVGANRGTQCESTVRARGLSKFPVRPDLLPCFPLCSPNKFPVSASREFVLKMIDFSGAKARHTGVIEALFGKFPCIFPC